MSVLHIGKDRVRCADVASVTAGRKTLEISRDPRFRETMRAVRAAFETKLGGDEVLYGVRTGFGASCSEAIEAEAAQSLATNLVRYHGCGLGSALSLEESTAVLVCRLAQLATGSGGGASAIRAETLDAIADLLRAKVIPRIPELGSVGASGDLTPMSYVAAVLGGEREAHFRGAIWPAKDALSAAGLKAWDLLPKESLSIMNGTSVMTALVALGISRAGQFARAHATVTAWNSLLLGGQAAHFDERIFRAKAHPGSVQYAGWVRESLGVRPRPAAHGGRVQDPYSLRCAPHVVGVLIDVLSDGDRTIEVELNGAGDNPLVCEETFDVLHGGNFYGGHVAHVADTLKLHVASSAEVLERQLMLLCHAPKETKIPENLVLAAGEQRASHHGFKAIEICASALVAEALKTSTPASAYSRSTEGHNQDKVPMGTLASRELRTILDLSESVLVMALLAAAQATDALGMASALPPHLRETYDWVRATCPAIASDQRTDLVITALLASYRNARVRGLA